MEHRDHPQHEPARRWTRGRWVLAGFMLVGAFFLWTEHRAHVLGILPYLLVLACPLMHLFHHHAHHQDHAEGSAPDQPKSAPSGEEKTS